jgi:hypothetical protein
MRMLGNWALKIIFAPNENAWELGTEENIFAE